MALEIHHQVFGELRYHYGWIREIELKLFGKERKIQLVIDADEDAEFDEGQLQAFLHFFSDIEKRVEDAEQAAYAYYQNKAKDREALTISSKDKFYLLVTPKQLIFPLVLFEENNREAGFICDCAWEEEHGLGIKFVNEEAAEVGFQDILF